MRFVAERVGASYFALVVWNITMKRKRNTDFKMRYKHKDARRDIRFIFSEQGLIFIEKAKELFRRVYNFHLLDKRKDKNKGKKKSCERCFRYYFKMSNKFDRERKKEREK